jgi:hypothetical protein
MLASPAWERAGEGSGNRAAEGATAPESLRQKDRAGLSTLWKARLLLAGATEGVTWIA